MPVYGSYSHCSRCYCCFHVSTSEIFLNYTDIHDVDEDSGTITSQGGRWGYGTAAGVTTRDVYYSSVAIDDVVASKNNHTLSLQRKSV